MTNSSFTGVAAGDNFFYNSSDGDVATDVTFDSNTVTDNLGGAGGATGSGPVQLVGGTAGTSTFDVENNNISGANGPGLIIDKEIENNTGAGNANAVLDAIVNNNTVATSGSASDGIDIDQIDGAQAGSATGTLNAGVTNNDVTQWGNIGIDLEAGDGAGGATGTFEATVTGNTAETTNVNDLQGIAMDGGTATGDAFNIYLTVGGSTAAEQNDVTEPTSSGIQDIRLLQRFDTTIFLTADDASGNPTVHYTGAATDTSAVAAFLVANNVQTAPAHSTATFDGAIVQSPGGGIGGTAPPNAPPSGATFATPSISGTATEGQTLAASLVGSSATYQWQELFSGSDYVDIDGATLKTYALQELDVGATLRVVETSTYGDGQIDTATSSNTTGAVADNLTLSTPTISGNATVGTISPPAHRSPTTPTPPSPISGRRTSVRVLRIFPAPPVRPIDWPRPMPTPTSKQSQSRPIRVR